MKNFVSHIKIDNTIQTVLTTEMLILHRRKTQFLSFSVLFSQSLTVIIPRPKPELQKDTSFEEK